MRQPQKLSNYTGSKHTNQDDYALSVDKDLKNIFLYLNDFPKVYKQAGIPTIPDNTIALAHNTTDGKYYFIVNIASVQKKVELI